jgi:hypothetical protein
MDVIRSGGFCFNSEQLGFKFRSSCSISRYEVCEQLVRITSVRVANTRGLVFIPRTVTNERNRIFLKTTVMRIWQFAVHRAQVLADRIKVVRDLPHLKKHLILTKI